MTSTAPISRSPQRVETKGDDGFYDSATPTKMPRFSSESSSVDNYDITPVKKSYQLSPKIFQDSVHGTIMMEPILVAIIDTPQFQRLRDIKQLGVAYWVYPGACHNRLEHCIGTSHLCGLMLSTLKSLHKNLYQDPIHITEKDIICVKIAGLIHDLGHGPFSHIFDGAIVPRMQPSSNWTHEQASCDLFDYMFESNPYLVDIFEDYGIEYQEREMIKHMIMGGPPKDLSVVDDTFYRGETYKKQFLYEIVSNKATGIDCDKFDYFARDTHHVGIKNSFDFHRYFKNVRILPIDGQLRICARDKEESNLYEMFHIRWTLHRQVYQHKTVALIAELVIQAFLLADETFGISSSINDMERYTYLTDSIFYEILRSHDNKDPSIVKARDYLKRVQTRQLYLYCGEINPAIIEDPDSNELRLSQQKLSQNDVLEGVASYGKGIDRDDIFVSNSYFSFGKKDQNPLGNMHFFGKDGRLKKPKLTDFSGLMPRAFEEQNLRVYSKSQEKAGMVKTAFVRWCKDNGYRVSSECE